LQELLSRKEHAALLTCIPSLTSEAMKLITSVIQIADGKADTLVRNKKPAAFPKGLKEGGAGNSARGAENGELKGGGKKWTGWETGGRLEANKRSGGKESEDQNPQVADDPRIAAMRTRPDGPRQFVEV
jgi:hypothetical protein